jgi:DNA-binding transcriptional LysR family regulator
MPSVAKICGVFDRGRPVIRKNHLFVILPTGHPSPPRAEVDLARLVTEPWIISERCRAQTMHAGALAGFTPTIALATDDYQQAVPRLVAAGLGVSLTTACVSRGTHHPDVVLVPVAGITPRRVIAALPANPRPTPAVSAVLDALQRAASQGTGGTDHEAR